MVTIVNPEFKYKETRRPNQFNTSKKPIIVGNINMHSGFTVSAWAPRYHDGTSSLPKSNHLNVFTPNHGE